MAISARKHGAYVQDVLYADFAGAKIGDAAKAGPSVAALGLAEKDN
jgi:hypothetical protein